ncbi:MAG: 3',5'-cyclic-nucleotide phosphodiesterase [Deltaproteobacteria bacterium]|nr:3',5'-cyclic-nucleotide phosphodiesterase [Deltaproteobacteria bacterium]
MKIRVLGCSGGQLPGYFPVSFFMNDHLILDAGSITSCLSLKDQHKIREILITHGHLDHIKDICFLAENLFLAGSYRTISIYSSEAILMDIKKNIFNGIVWPDMTKSSFQQAPIYSLRSIKKMLSVNGLSIEATAVTHSHAALGYIISDKKGAVVFSGDTGATDELWEKVNRTKNIRAIFLECSFPSALSDIAWKSRHLSTSSVIRELQKIKNTKVPIYLYHLKPVYFEKIQSEIKKLGNSRLHILKSGSTLNF